MYGATKVSIGALRAKHGIIRPSKSPYVTAAISGELATNNLMVTFAFTAVVG